MIYLSFKYELVERQRMWVIIVLLFFTAVFWSFFELAGRSISSRDFVSKEFVGPVVDDDILPVRQRAVHHDLRARVRGCGSNWQRPDGTGAPVKFAIGLGLLGAGFLSSCRRPPRWG